MKQGESIETYRQAIIPLTGANKEEVVNAGKRVVSNFIINNRDVYAQLHQYFHGQGQLDQNKGIALTGTYGVGKSTIFRVFHEYLRTKYPFNSNLFIIISIEDLISELNENDWVNKKYTNNNKEDMRGGKYNDPRHILVNEFGFQYNIKSFGTDVNELIEAWLMKRYDIFQQQKKLVHITTNFSKKELESKFHPKIVDRFKEMFNFIEYNGKSMRI
jgi:DNA replication protein DnaC